MLTVIFMMALYIGVKGNQAAIGSSGHYTFTGDSREEVVGFIFIHIDFKNVQVLRVHFQFVTSGGILLSVCVCELTLEQHF